MSPRTLVLGAGLQGCCAALALADQGHQVTLLDRCPELYQRTSVRGEGKIHLGFVYANDPSFRTAERMLQSALAFGPALEQLLGHPVAWPEVTTAPFWYLVAQDSMVPPEALLEFYGRLEARHREALRDTAGHYLGARPARLFHPDTPPPGVDPARVAQAVRTVERAVDPLRIRDLVLGAVVARPEIRRLPGRRVRSIEERGAGLRVEGEDAQGSPWRLQGDLVVNCLWDQRMGFDRQLGLGTTETWVHRLKYRVLAEAPAPLASLPSMTIVLGPYGDLVQYPASGLTYLSWYPDCLQGWAIGDRSPEAWDTLCEGGGAGGADAALAARTLQAFDVWVPGLRQARVRSVAAGVIVAPGETDITDPASSLHRRDSPAVLRRGGYLSMSTGKLTCAPSNALELVARLEADSG